MITLKTLPSSRPPIVPPENAEDDGLRPGQVWAKGDGRSRGGHPKFYIITRLTPSSVHCLVFCAKTGEFRKTGEPSRKVFLIGMEKVGRVRNMPEVFALDVEWFGDRK